jgi:hypothetical protein
MFSVDNFYTFMNSHYGLDSDNQNILYFFRPHGSKNWNDLCSGFIDLVHQTQHRSFYSAKGSIILHDQEPFDQSLLDIYKHEISVEKNEIWRRSQPTEEVILLISDLSIGWPIFCHSENNSDDIEIIRKLSIDCHYFWHGLISRDWFRHWKHHGGISIDKSRQHRFLLYARDCTGSRHYRSQLINDLLPIKKTVKYNWDQTTIVCSDFSAKISVEDAQSSSIHLVAETLFDKNKIHLTEKIFKPIVMMQPFIVFAGMGALEYLRKYGFQTFGDIWDESYDLISNHEQRYQKILDLILSLSKLDEKVLDQKIEQARSIVLHNHQRFFSNGFEDQMLKELKANMSACLSWQDEKTKQFPGGSLFYVIEQRIKRGDYNFCSDTINGVNLKGKIAGLLRFLKEHDRVRYDSILRQHHTLCRDLV